MQKPSNFLITLHFILLNNSGFTKRPPLDYKYIYIVLSFKTTVWHWNQILEDYSFMLYFVSIADTMYCKYMNVTQDFFFKNLYVSLLTR